MSNTNLTIHDLFDLETAQKLQDLLVSITKTRIIIVDENLSPFTKRGGGKGICKHVHAAKGCRGACYEGEISRLCQESRLSAKPALGSCAETGLTIASVPIFVGDNYLGMWLFGPESDRELDSGFLEKLSLVLNKPVEEMPAYAKEIPVIAPSDCREILNTLMDVSYKLLNHNLSKKAFAKFVDSTTVEMFVADYATGEIIMANKAYAEIRGLSIKEAIGRKCWEIHRCSGEGFCANCPKENILDEEGNPKGPFQNHHFDKKLGRWYKCSNQATRWMDGRMVLIASQIDVTREYNMENELYQLAYFDQKLAIANSARLMKDVDHLLHHSPDNLPYLVFFNIAAMQQLNDAHGYECGDELLRQVVKWVQAQDYGEKTLYRIDGNEFCLMLKASNEAHASFVAHDIFRRFYYAWILEVDDQLISYFCGVYASILMPIAGFKYTDIMGVSRRTLNISRKESRVVVYDTSMDMQNKDHSRMLLELKNCVKNDMEGFDVVFQPIVEMSSGTWKALEALCRWKAPGAGIVGPDVFIKEAEQNGLIKQIGHWVLETAICRCKELGLDNCEDFFLSVNVSPMQIMDYRFAANVGYLLEYHNYPGSKLVLEVTESMEFTFNSFTLGVFEELSKHQVRIALDDFGTGYSNYSKLRNLPVNLLKTERDFIAGIEDDHFLQYFYHAVADISHASGIKLVAEGIETYEQLAVTIRNGADYLQGFYFSKPLTMKELEKSISNFEEVHRDLELLKVRGLDNYDFLMKDVNPSSLHPLYDYCLEAFFAPSSLDLAFEQVLERLSRHLDLCAGVILFWQEKHSFSSHIWGGSPKLLELLRGFSQELAPTFKLEENFVSGDLGQLDLASARRLEEEGVNALALRPILMENKLVGVLCFCSSGQRIWLQEELMFLWNLGRIIGDIASKKQAV